MSKSAGYFEDLVALHWEQLQGAAQSIASELLLDAMTSTNPEATLPDLSLVMHAAIVEIHNSIPECLRGAVVEDKLSLPIDMGLWDLVVARIIAMRDRHGLDTPAQAEQVLTRIMHSPRSAIAGQRLPQATEAVYVNPQAANNNGGAA